MIETTYLNDSVQTSVRSHILDVECSLCKTKYNYREPLTYCSDPYCNGILTVTYDYKYNISKEILNNRPFNMWRYRELLPVLTSGNQISLGEGGTPLFKARNLSKLIGIPGLYWKDEGGNPTGSFKARGMSVAVSKAKELGIKKIAIPTAGNAGVALSAYGARAGIEVHVYMPKETPENLKNEIVFYGAHLVEVDGNIGDCGKLVAEHATKAGWFNLSTLKEPYRLEGKKTMGYELAEQFNWNLPDVILYPTGGGTGLIGFWKAFEEMECLGWIGKFRPRLIAVQSNNCDSIVTAFHNKLTKAVAVDKGFTIANGLRVPKSFADKLILKILYDCHGTAVSVNDFEIKDSLTEIARLEGMFIAPEGAALWAALKKLKTEGIVTESEKVVMVNTGNGSKYTENIFN